MLKAVFWDFDDTLAVWPEKLNAELTAHIYNICQKVLAGEDPYEGLSCSPRIAAEMKRLSETKQVKHFALSWLDNSINFKAKQDFISRNYSPEVKLFAASSPEAKLDVVEHIRKHYGWEKEEIMMVDDLCKTVDDFIRAGYRGTSPMDVMLNGINEEDIN